MDDVHAILDEFLGLPQCGFRRVEQSSVGEGIRVTFVPMIAGRVAVTEDFTNAAPALDVALIEAAPIAWMVVFDVSETLVGFRRALERAALFSGAPANDS